MMRIVQGDAMEQLQLLPDNSVHCCVTSPPYWQLRNYGVAGQIGLEATIGEYVEKIRQVFAEVRRVLRADGTCWMNLGDCYAASGCGGDTGRSGLQGSTESQDQAKQAKKGGGPRIGSRSSFRRDRAQRQDIPHKANAGLKPKDLCGIPWRVAFALQDDGWYLRSDIIWHKPNPMPESITDRPTKAHEYVFLLTKSARYFYDAEAIKEAVSGTAHERGNGVNPKARVPVGWDTGKGGHREMSGRYEPKQNESFSGAVNGLVSRRNKRDVWTIPTHAYPGNHYATFPPELVKPCILAGTSAHGCCASCGAPYERVVEDGAPDLEHQRQCGGDLNGEYHGEATKDFTGARAQDASATKARILRGMVEKVTTGWEAQCECGASVVPCTVLDPFGGSGTTGLVAVGLGRAAIMIELDPAQCATMNERAGLFADQPGLAAA